MRHILYRSLGWGTVGSRQNDRSFYQVSPSLETFDHFAESSFCWVWPSLKTFDHFAESSFCRVSTACFENGRSFCRVRRLRLVHHFAEFAGSVWFIILPSSPAPFDSSFCRVRRHHFAEFAGSVWSIILSSSPASFCRVHRLRLVHHFAEFTLRLVHHFAEFTLRLVHHFAEFIGSVSIILPSHHFPKPLSLKTSIILPSYHFVKPLSLKIFDHIAEPSFIWGAFCLDFVDHFAESSFCRKPPVSNKKFKTIILPSDHFAESLL